MQFFMKTALVGLTGIAMMSASLAHADGPERLRAFYQNTVGLKAQFKQTVSDAQGRKVQEVTGNMQLQRPGKFRWDYQKPYVQEIVGDGQKVWLYDPELNQVTVRSLSKAIGSSPAAMLAGSKEMEKSFALQDGGNQAGLEWVKATPREKESGFEQIMIGFKGDQLAQMELLDSFGHRTLIEFSQIERNPTLASQAFRFVPPAGADVVGE
jgi:outer membrane lipoprotein carrier protein